ncbi:MAG: NAD(+)/NADH kinase [Clostridia bacterium]
MALKNIALIVNLEKERGRETALRLIAALRGRANIYCSKEAQGLLPVTALDDRELFALCPTVVTLGGDGTIINTAGRCAPYGNILLGINLGRLGFLATVEASRADAVADFILSDVDFQERTMLACRIKGSDGVYSKQYHALNDVVLSRGTGRLLSVSAYMDGRLITGFRADGAAIATPTGSTAYSLSTGGPLAAPDMDLFILSPICPHNLSARSMVLPTDRVITLETQSEALVTVDGQNLFNLSGGECVEIRKSPYITRLAVSPGTDFYELVRKKLISNI